MRIQSARFGELEVEEHSVIHFPDGIAPFGNNLHFALLPGSEQSSTAWLQSLQHPELAFWVGHSAKLFPDDDIGIDAHRLHLVDIQRPEQLCVLVILTVQQSQVTANLLAPILINIEQRAGRQVILSGSMDLIRVPVPIDLVVAQPA